MAAIPNHQNLVATVKAALLAQGADLSGPCGAFRITKNVAWALRSEGAGLLAKPSGNNCEGYATDIVMYPDGAIFDILIDGGGANTPAWNAGAPVNPNGYRPAIDPGPVPVPVPTPTPPPTTPPPDLRGVLSAIAALDTKIDALSTAVAALAQAQTMPPSYSGNVFGFTVVLHPTK